jgi:hypothetical protein
VCILNYHLAHEAAGALGTRHSPRPLFSGRTIQARPGRIAPRERGWLVENQFAVIACDKREAFAQGSEATKQSILSPRGDMDCFASLAMTIQIIDYPVAAMRKSNVC